MNIAVWLRRAGAASVLMAAAGCVTTTTTDGGPGRPPVAVAPDVPADPARRAAVRMELALAYFGRGQSATALAEVQSALAAAPDMASAHILAGLIQADLGDEAKAEQSFRRGLQLDPRDPDSLHNYGWFLCQRRRYDEADASFTQALAQPGYRDSARTLLVQGVCLARSGALDAAERVLSRAYEIEPANPTTAVNLSEVLYRMGALDRARFYIRRVNAVPEQVSAQTLWLAARIENKLGNVAFAQDFGQRLREGYAQSPEALKFDRGQFDE